MTLTTRIIIVEPTPVREVFDECRRIIGAQHGRFRHEGPTEFGPPGASVYRNESGQGFPALLWVDYGADAPLRPGPEYPDDGPVDEWSIEVNFDTAYAYTGPYDGDSYDLHAWIMQQLGRWLAEHGLTWYWRHEFTGEWHPASAPVTSLGNPERGRLRGVGAARGD